MRWPHRWTRAHRRETPRERAMCEGRRAIRQARAWSEWLKVRPFGDRY